MTKIELRFLEALKASLRKEQVNWEEPMPVSDWLLLFRMAEVHHILPLIYEAVFRCPAALMLEDGVLVPFHEKTKRYVYTQVMKTNEFHMLSNYLAKKGMQPLVVKGIMCRNMYPEPDYRLSSDEDLLIPEHEFAKYHETLLAYGLELAEPEKDIWNAYEVPYVNPGRHLYIELHKHLFPPDSEAFGDLNLFFKNVHKDAITEVNSGQPIRSLCYTDHMFYLICHAYKHFLHSGFGIRQVCDIVMFANHYKGQIDWSKVYNSVLLFQQCILRLLCLPLRIIILDFQEMILICPVNGMRLILTRRICCRICFPVVSMVRQMEAVYTAVISR